MKKYLIALVAGVLLAAAAPASAQSAPNKIATVQAVMAAHPEIDRCDDNARGAIVDYTAHRLNAEIGRVVWGRKARSADGANPNTDGLTFLLPDGRFEIVDVISGASPCGATWDNAGAFSPGQNGFWTAPKLGPEPGGPTVPPPPPPPTDDAVLDELRAQTALLNAIHLQLDTQAMLTRDTNAAIDKLRVDVIKSTKDLLPQLLKILPLLGAFGGGK